MPMNTVGAIHESPAAKVTRITLAGWMGEGIVAHRRGRRPRRPVPR